jgi:serine/threonine-protein kinase
MEEIPPGTSVAGFRIEALVGSGGMGMVYRAVQKSLERTVALKVLPSTFARTRPDKRDRFLREARIAGRLSHENIVQIIDAGRHGNHFFIAMEFVEGEDLGRLVRRHGPLPQRVCLAVAIQSAKALVAAGESRLVHRDIKPENIIVTPKGVVKVADFGLAKDVTSEAKLTRPGAVMGTPSYMSPEQARGEVVDGRSDIYSLGATLYFSATGFAPFRGPTALETIRKLLTRPVPPPGSLAPELEPPFCAVLEKALNKDREARYQTPSQLLEDLEALSTPGPASLSAPRESSRATSAELGELTIDLPPDAALGESDYFGRFSAETVDEVSAEPPPPPAQDVRARALLFVERPGLPDLKVFLFTSERVRFGRSEEAEEAGQPVRVDLVLRALPFESPRRHPEKYRKNLAISRFHGWFELGPEGMSVTDRDGSLGISVDGQALEKNRPFALRDGSRIVVGRDSVRLHLRLPPADPAPCAAGGEVREEPGPACALMQRSDEGCDHAYLLLRTSARLDRLFPQTGSAPLWIVRTADGLAAVCGGEEGKVTVDKTPLRQGRPVPLRPGSLMDAGLGKLLFEVVTPRDFKEP